MKKPITVLTIVLLLILLLSCEQPRGLSVIVPSGSPALAQIFVQSAERDTVDVVNGSDPLVAAFGSGSHDVIFAPTNLGAKMIASGSGYAFAAAVVWGNYHLVTTGWASFAIDDLEGAEIVAFGQNQTSDIILRHVLASNGIEATITYVDAVATAASLFAAEPTRIVLTAEPSLSALRGVVAGLQSIDLQAAYADLHEGASYPQAGVFVKDGLDPEDVARYLEDLAASIAAVVADPAAAAAEAERLEFGFPVAVMAAAIPGSHLVFVDAIDARADLEAYFAVILALNPALIGGVLPGDSFYHEP